MKSFRVKTTSNNTIPIPAKSEFHGRKLFAAKYAKSFGKLVSITEVKPMVKPTMKIMSGDRVVRG